MWLYLPAPFPLPHVVQVRDTWRRPPIGSFKPRRGSGGGGLEGEGEEGAGDKGWMNGEAGAGEEEGRGRGRAGCHPRGSQGQTGKGVGGLGPATAGKGSPLEGTKRRGSWREALAVGLGAEGSRERPRRREAKGGQR